MNHRQAQVWVTVLVALAAGAVACDGGAGEEEGEGLGPAPDGGVALLDAATGEFDADAGEPEADAGTVTPPPMDPPDPPEPTGGFPTALTTGPLGAGVAYDDLTPSGSRSVTVDGTVLDMLDITGQVLVYADNVVIRRSRIRHTETYGIRVMDGAKGLLVEDTEVVGVGSEAGVNVAFRDYTLRRVNLHGAHDGAKAQGDVLIEDSFIHDLGKWPGTHNDGIQNSGSPSPGPILIRRNTILGPYQTSTSAIIALTNQGPIDRMVIEENFLSGGSYVVYLDDKGTGFGPPTNSAIRNNVFEAESTGVYRNCREKGGTRATCHVTTRFLSVAGTVARSGNIWDDGVAME